MNDSDTLSRFLFEHAGIRGNLVHLDASWRAALEAHPYPEPVAARLGEALAAASLLAATIKFEGSLILQIQGSGPIRTLVAQATHARTVRGLARWEAEVPAADSLSAQFGTGQLVLTIDQGRGQPYQGVIPLAGARLTDAIEHYFTDSEQIPTRLWLAAGPSRASGLLLQRLPEAGATEEDWNRVTLLADTLTPGELLDLATEPLLHRLFHEETVRLFESEPVSFRCGCSRSRIADMVKLLGESDIDHLLDEHGAIEVTCEFCNRLYRFDPVDARQLFAGATRHAPPATQQ
ncbi:Hsp33 family molecular chaperone HslO [Allochromatium vinosum]|uniref:33 kDa chaperonin n=1 Tax=Allochromatium vinosum (strain ATCC 17899 / DSM 180 / NBRC 103801 / NCIMB 10441 / D) TaxID=572477 RepID=D3RTD4_ALLVD|nr:Hsp33 family molecular chaperone HslO [Allochromatium vinosum]ADC62443.1 Hsp33 protein [Allochromatium vinosum DSM 180]